MLNIYPQETVEYLKFTESPSVRSIYKTIERVGEKFNFILEKYHFFLRKHNLISKKQFMNFSSSYSEGVKSEIGLLGHSRDS